MATTCPACKSQDLKVVFEFTDAPIHANFLWQDASEARHCPRGDIVLAFCTSCGLIVNTTFDESKMTYKAGYENSLHHSEVFRRYTGRLADGLIRKFDLHGKRIADIGCGKGEFLYLLCEKGGNWGTGFDPSHVSDEDGQRNDRVNFVTDYYSEKYSEIEFDFICSRHTLEHIQNPFDLLAPLRRSIGDRAGTKVFFEVPNGRYTIENRFIWDIIYEHPCYFTEQSLSHAFATSGFQVDHTYEEFDGQYLCIEATAVVGRADRAMGPSPGVAGELDTFTKEVRRYRDEWGERLRSLAASGKRAALWGAGSKGIMFLNTFGDDNPIDVVVDLNPAKHGMFVAGTGHRIVAPGYLSSDPPDMIIGANPIYKSEIEAIVGDLGVAAEFLYL